jgi:hypothetical protein
MFFGMDSRDLYGQINVGIILGRMLGMQERIHYVGK